MTKEKHADIPRLSLVHLRLTRLEQVYVALALVLHAPLMVYHGLCVTPPYDHDTAA